MDSKYRENNNISPWNIKSHPSSREVKVKQIQLSKNDDLAVVNIFDTIGMAGDDNENENENTMQ